MKYNYSDMYSTEFEQLAIFICHFLLGTGVKGFSTGMDGGRDARFIGRANEYPSSSAPWEGTTIIQAKHTLGYSQSFSDSGFFSDKSSNNIIANEVKKIRKLRESGELDHYMLFSNRRLSGIADTKITTYISECANVPKEDIGLFGIEQIENYIKRYPRIVEMAHIDPIDCPLSVSPHDLAEVIEAFSALQKDEHRSIRISEIERTSFEEKNELNDMPENYANSLLKRCLKDTHPIKQFLSAPGNEKYIELYKDITDEFHFKILAHKKEFQTFDKVMNYLLDLLYQRDHVLARNKKLTRLMLFYMYWNCDIGENKDA